MQVAALYSWLDSGNFRTMYERILLETIVEVGRIAKMSSRINKEVSANNQVCYTLQENSMTYKGILLIGQ